MLLTPDLTRLRATACAAVLALASAACSDRANPLAPEPVRPPGSPSAPIVIQILECTGQRAALTVDCVPASPISGARGDIVVGSTGAKLTSSNVAYNSGTGVYTFDVTVQNLIEQRMGTTDGTTLDPNGVRVFFQSGPTVTGGSGTISVIPDGFDTFTGAAQPYYQHAQVLAQNAVSSARTWTFNMPSTVTSFSFTLYVSAPVQYPTGYVTLDGNLPGGTLGSLHPDSTHALAAVIKSAAGVTQSGTVTFSSSDPGCATVDASGVVTGVRAGTCTITATSGTRSGSIVVPVAGTRRTWTGAVSSLWNVGGNWAGGVVPGTLDTVVIPTGVPNFPGLVADVTVGSVTVADLATLDVGAFVLTASSDVGTGPTAGWGIRSSTTGSVVLTGIAHTVHGRLPAMRVLGTYSLDGQLWAQVPQEVSGGRLTATGYEITITP
ncbi:MAG TPA: Ig-like domain-containing protein [Longimicrobium sp.]|nr:Ig-like domain-containing protein [Longimicrobium sp.]